MLLLLLAALQADPEPILRLEEPGTLARHVDWSDRGISVVHRRGVSEFAVLRDAKTGAVLGRTPEVGEGYSAVSGSLAAFAPRDGTVVVFGLPDGPAREPFGPGRRAYPLAFAPDGRTLALGGRPTTLVDAVTGRLLAELEGSPARHSFAFSADGARFAAALSPDGLGVWDTASGRRLLTLDAPFWCSERTAFSPDGRRLVYAAPDKVLRVWSLPDGKPESGLSFACWSPMFSPDGRRLAVLAPDRSVRLFAFPSLAPAGIVGRHARNPITLAWSPDGTRIASGDLGGTLLVWQAPKPKKIVLLAAEPDDHPPGTHLYVKNARVVQRGLEAAYGAAVKVELHPKGWPDDPATLDDADAIFLTSAGGDRKLEMHPFYVGDRFDAVAKQMKRGCGLMFFHWSTFHPAAKHDLVTEWVGGYFDYETGPAPRKWYSAIETKEWTTVLPSPDHPIARGVKPFPIREEFYFKTRFRDADPRLVPFLACREGDARANAVGWAVERADGGRGVGFTGGHFYRNWANADFRKLVLNAVAWSAKLELPAGGVESAFEDETDSEKARVTLSLKDATLKQVLDAVAKQTGIRVETDGAAKAKLGEKADVEWTDLVVSGALKLLALSHGLEVDVVPGGVKLRAP
jgi:trehalose utilization protein